MENDVKKQKNKIIKHKAFIYFFVLVAVVEIKLKNKK